MPDRISVREARPDEAETLTELALRSKAYWGYPDAFLKACRDELTVPADRIGTDRYVYSVAECGGEIAGFAGLERLSDEEYELEALFVDPPHIGTGVGRHLMRHVVDTVAAKRGRKIIIQGDPNADTFYRAAGARRVGERESGSVPGRFLPLFEIDVPPGRD